MHTINNFYDLLAWQKAHLLVLGVYRVTNNFPVEERYGMVSQLRRASSSITANIAEGFSRYHFKDKVKFYYQARGSVAEVQNFLILAMDLGFINRDVCQKLGEQSHEAKKLINGLIKSIEKQK